MPGTEPGVHKGGSGRRGLISNPGFIQSLRSNGIHDITAIQELIDNSIDWGSKQVHVHILQEKQGDPLTIIVEDDGEGMPPDRITAALSLGATFTRTDVLQIGRFGMGLVLAGISITKRIEVYSGQGGKWAMSFLDIDAIVADPDWIPPEPIEVELVRGFPEILEPTRQSGTVVIFRDCDQAGYTRRGDLRNALVSQLGETYRYSIAEDGIKILVNGTEVEADDPMCLMPKSRSTRTIGQAEEVLSVSDIDFEDVMDPTTGEPAKIQMRVVVLPVLDEHKNVRKGIEGVSAKKQGFYLVRGKRQIAGGENFRMFAPHPEWNWVRGEIRFPPCLDSRFGIQFNKSKFEFRPEMKELLWNGRLRNPMNIGREIVKRRRKEAGEQPDAQGILPSERAAKKAWTHSHRLRYKHEVSEERVHERQKRHQKEVQERVKQIEREKIDPEEKRKRLAELSSRESFDLPIRIELELVPDGLFYRAEADTKERWTVYINRGHVFYDRYYEPLRLSGKSSGLEILLMALAKAELLATGTPSEALYREERQEWNSHLMALMDQLEPIEADEPFREPDE